MNINVHFWSYHAQFFLVWEIFQLTVVVKIKTVILCSVTFFDNRSLYVIMWKNITEPGRPQMIIWRMRIACWTPTKATNKHSEYVIFNDFPLQRWLYECISLLSYTYFACLLRSEFDDAAAGVLALFVLYAKMAFNTSVDLRWSMLIFLKNIRLVLKHFNENKPRLLR